MTIKKLKSIDIINVLSDLVSEKLETTVKLPGCLFVFYYVLNVFTPFKYGWMEFKCLMYLAIIVILGMRIKLQSPLMEWVGDHSLEIYLVHGLFFEILRNNHINIVDNFEFMVTLLILTFISSYVLHKIFTLINKIISN